MRPLVRLFHRILCVQGAHVREVALASDASVEVSVSLHGNTKPKCPTCHQVMRLTGVQEHVKWRHLDLFRVTCFLAADLRIGRCPRHGQRLECVPWATPRARHTRAFDRQVASLVQVADRSAAARMFGIVWRTVERIVKRVVAEELPRDLLDGVIAITVDETSYKRGHRYVTVVTDLLERRVIWVGEGKSGRTLEAFFEELGKRRSANLEVVAIDMSAAYIAVLKDRVPQADVVFDRFHVVKLMLEAIDEIRRDECRQLRGDARQALKGMRYAFLANPKFKRPRDVQAIKAAVRSNRRLLAAYERRISFEHLWEYKSEAHARGFLMRWTRSALLSRLKPLRRFARTVRAHLDGILGFVRYEGTLTSAFAEGMNNKIKLQLHKAFGFATVAGFMAMIKLCCCGIDLRQGAA